LGIDPVVSGGRGRAWPGLLLPGLGHLLTGRWVHGLGMLGVDGLLLLAAGTGWRRLGGWWLDPPGGGQALHVVVALIVWGGCAVALWRAAIRRVWPTGRGPRWPLVTAILDHPTGVLGVYGVTLLLVLASLAPLLAPFDPNAVFVADRLGPPDGVCWMGTDRFGRDVYSRVLHGAWLSLLVGFLAVSIAATMGTLIGATAAFAGGWVDRGLMFVTDGLIALPKIVLLLAIVGLLRLSGPVGALLVIAVLGATSWMGVARIVRGQMLSLKEQDFILAARALGLSSSRILLRHLIPNAAAPVIIYASLAVGGAMMAEASLSFLGLGMPPPTATWGTMIADGKDSLRYAPHVAGFPGLAIIGAVMSFNLLGDGLRDVLDPRVGVSPRGRG